MEGYKYFIGVYIVLQQRFDSVYGRPPEFNDDGNCSNGLKRKG